MNAAASERPPSQPRLLLVEDDNELWDLLARVLELEGFDLCVARNGVQALAEARARRPDIILADVAMPHLDGFGLLAALKQDTALRDVPVVIYSVWSEEGTQARCRSLGAAAYLVKPTPVATIVAVLKEQLAGRA